jgi:hypothetical protein
MTHLLSSKTIDLEKLGSLGYLMSSVKLLSGGFPATSWKSMNTVMLLPRMDRLDEGTRLLPGGNDCHAGVSRTPQLAGLVKPVHANKIRILVIPN